MRVCELPKWVLGTDWILNFLEDNNCSLTAKPSLQPRKDVFKIMEIIVRRDPDNYHYKECVEAQATCYFSVLSLPRAIATSR